MAYMTMSQTIIENGQSAPQSSIASLSRKRLEKLFYYNPNTGDFTRRVATTNSVKVGDVAGCENTAGYLVIRIDGTLYLVHRLAWFYMFGVWPKTLDHADTCKWNNALANLRLATRAQNNHNKSAWGSLGIKGVTLVQGKYYIAQIRDGVTNRYLGCFKTAKEASQAYQKAAKEIYGEFANG